MTKLISSNEIQEAIEFLMDWYGPNWKDDKGKRMALDTLHDAQTHIEANRRGRAHQGEGRRAESSAGRAGRLAQGHVPAAEDSGGWAVSRASMAQALLALFGPPIIIAARYDPWLGIAAFLAQMFVLVVVQIYCDRGQK